ncbi:MAG: hypothetical protein P9M04_02895 [Candidatus Orphnella occulta]|nr:hypothetical protein [Candidatus Orphnella occulta]
MKPPHIKCLTFLIIAAQLIFNHPIIAYAAEIRSEQGLEAEYAFYDGNYSQAEYIFDALCQKEDRDYAFWNNQLGSVYLADGKYDLAEEAFLKSYYLMNDIKAFKEYELGAISLFGSEAKKAYKGDPYEKLFNALYVALLLNRTDDLENSMAAIKTGILCDSDVQADLYKSDSAVLYLLAARIALLRGDKEKSKEYYEEALRAYRMTSTVNVALVYAEQAQFYLLKEKQEERNKLAEPKKKNKKRRKQIEALDLEINQIDKDIKKLQIKREANNPQINTSMLSAFTDLSNNTLLCVEVGEGPIKYQAGKYGQFALFTLKPYDIKRMKILVDGKELSGDIFAYEHDIFFQAITRGGRKMDNILKGQAQFKQTTSDVAVKGMQVSQNIIKNANSQAMANPYYNSAGATMAAGAVMLVSLCFAVASAAANPTADIRHWSLLPNDIFILPCSLPVGKHKIVIECYDNNNILAEKRILNVDIKSNKKGDNVFFTRIS